jgi:glycosyltransferase involved in cell wall biosynthesis
MRIGIDAKWYFTGPVSTQVILHNLLPRLFETYKEHSWFIFLDKRDKEKKFPLEYPDLTLIYIPVPNNMVSNLFILPRFARTLDLDVVVFQTYPAVKKKFASIAFIHDVLFREFPDFFTWKEKLYFLPLKWFSRRADRLIATTASVAADLVKYNYVDSASKIDIVPLGVSSKYKPLEQHDLAMKTQLKEKYNLPQHFILFVGRLNVRKNIEALLKALPLLHDKSIKLVVAGKEDWKKPDLKELIKDPFISNRVIFTGSLMDDELVVLYSMATIFCFPSFAEGFGLPPIEAMASGIPVIVSRTTSLPEVCGEAAIYTDPNNPEDITNAINNLLETDELYSTQRKKGLQRSSELTWDETCRTLMKSILKAVKNKP